MIPKCFSNLFRSNHYSFKKGIGGEKKKTKQLREIGKNRGRKKMRELEGRKIRPKKQNKTKL